MGGPKAGDDRLRQLKLPHKCLSTIDVNTKETLPWGNGNRAESLRTLRRPRIGNLQTGNSSLAMVRASEVAAFHADTVLHSCTQNKSRVAAWGVPNCRGQWNISASCRAFKKPNRDHTTGYTRIGYRDEDRLSSKWLGPESFVTQIISSHGNFVRKLAGLGVRDEGNCTCGVPETVGHVLLECGRVEYRNSHWSHVRFSMKTTLLIIKATPTSSPFVVSHAPYSPELAPTLFVYKASSSSKFQLSGNLEPLIDHSEALIDPRAARVKIRGLSSPGPVTCTSDLAD
ncbi:hypothetical protein AAG570_005490 [Ranatra chinensis]|uniref:Reverse transcriptase n=1 Tax=Ranatra chinensis TaxID=642074 RepID=A0ABD0XZA4_9HEMI